MKKFFALLALVLGVVSCQTEPEGFDVNTGAEQDAVITVALPEGTRANSALGAFENVDFSKYDVRFQCEVWYGDSKKVLPVQYGRGNDAVATATFPVRLIANRDYTFVVWADLVKEGETADLHYNTADLTNITLNNTWVAMDETRDAFTCSEPLRFERGNAITLELKRPFAKLRVVTTDMLELMGIEPTSVEVEYTTTHYNTYNALTKEVAGEVTKEHVQTPIAPYDYEVGDENKTLFTDYFFATVEQETVNFVMNVYDKNNELIDEEKKFITPIPVERNYVTTIKGNILTFFDNITVEIKPDFAGEKEVAFVEVESANDLFEAIKSAEAGEETIITLVGDINLNDLLSASTFSTRATADPTVLISAGKAISLNLNGKTLSATSYQSGANYNMFDVRGTLSLANGTIEYKHEGENMGWGASTNLFNVTAGGVLNLDGVTAKNLGGSDMGFVAHLNNWGEVTLNVENSTLESNYVAVRVFNSGPDMNNVTIKNSTLKGGSNAFWVHNYTVEDFGTEAKAEAQKALLNFDILDESNTFSPIVGIRFGFTNSLRFDSYGISRSEVDGVVTLSKLFGEGVVRRGVAGTESNTTIKKVVVEEGIAELPNRTFYRYKALEEVVLPNTLTVLGAKGEIYSNGNIFQGCSALKNIVIPESVTTMGPGVFYGCSSLEAINIPAGITSIEENALRETGLKSIEFHEDVTYFGTQAFRDCKQLTEVVINAPEFTMENNTFGIMAAPFTPMSIYVANAEMKAYVESKLTDHAKTYITVKAPVAVTDKASLQAEMAKAIKAGEKNIFIDGTNFSGDLNYGFSNANLPAGVTVTIRNAKVTATSKWNYLNGTLIFEDCEFTAGLYSIHFDDNDGVGDVVFKNCKLVGWLPFAAINSVTFEGCHLTGNGSYALIRSYANLTLKNCVIDTTRANHNDEYTDGVQAIAPATLTEENVTYIDNHTAYLQNVLEAGKHVVLSSDLTINEGITAPYGNKTALSQKGGIFDGNGKTITADLPGDNYIYMTNGGTTKDLNITGAFRGIMIMNANQTVYLENVVSGGTGVVYALNTGEGDSTQDLVATNCTFNGWSSWSLLKSATFTNCTFGQGSEYSNVIGRLGKPYVNTVFEGCDFCSKYYLDLSSLGENHKVTLKNCTVNGVKITANNWASLVAPEDTCGDGHISVELKNGTYLTADNVADYIIFE